MYCNKCGNEIKEGEKFCGKCGNKVKEHKDKNYIKYYDISKKVLKISCIVLLITIFISWALTMVDIYWFGENIGKFIMIIGGISAVVSLITCNVLAIKNKIKMSLWINIITGIVIAGIIGATISNLIESNRQKRYEENRRKITQEYNQYY